MNNALHAEIRKLLTVRTTYALAALAVVIAVLVTFGGDKSNATETAGPLWQDQSWLFTSLLTRVIFVIVGIRIVTEEYRYRTLTSSLLATASRSRMLAAKALTAAAASVMIAGLAILALVAANAVFWAQHDIAFTLTGDDVLAMAGMTAAAALYGALGVGIGAIVRQPVPATVGAVFWFLFGEEALGARLGDTVNWLPGHAGLGLSVLPDLESSWQALGGAAMLGWALLSVAAGVTVLRRQDVA